MKILSKVDDRKKLVKTLEKATGLQAKYLSAPTFCYEIGPYTVGRDGNITVDDPDPDIVALLVSREMVEQPEEETAYTIISLPMEGHTGKSLKNLVYMLNSRSVLLGKVVGWSRIYWVIQELIEALEEKSPVEIDDFLQILEDTGEGAIGGLVFSKEKIRFLFPYTADEDRVKAYMQLATLMNEKAKKVSWTKPDRCKITNEKYVFHVWLLQLGMVGEEYKTARRILFQYLQGHVAFRTKDQKEAATQKLKEKRAREREIARETAFNEL